MSDVERFWNAAIKHFNTNTPTWHELNPQAQHAVLNSINVLLAVIYGESKNGR